MDEVLLTRDFDTLDLDGDGRWTYAEAKKLDERHRALTGHRTNLGSVFDNLMLLVRQFAQSHPSFLCKPGDYVAGFLENQGWWYRNLTILGQQVHSGQKGTIVQSNAFTYGYNTLDKYFKVTEVSLMTMPDEVGTVCRMAPCIDTDYGRLDGTHHGGCAWYGFEGLTMEEEYPLGMNGSYDSGGLRLRDLCCFFGGGTTSPNRTGFGSYPINLAVQDIFPVTEFFQCTENHRESHCMRQFASMPRRYYKQELEPLLDLCLVADVDMCGNLLSRQAWPGLFAQGLKKHFWDMLENVTVPLLFKAAGTSEVRQLKAEAHCEAVMTHICPVPRRALRTCVFSCWVTLRSVLFERRIVAGGFKHLHVLGRRGYFGLVSMGFCQHPRYCSRTCLSGSHAVCRSVGKELQFPHRAMLSPLPSSSKALTSMRPWGCGLWFSRFF